MKLDILKRSLSPVYKNNRQKDNQWSTKHNIEH